MNAKGTHSPESAVIREDMPLHHLRHQVWSSPPSSTLPTVDQAPSDSTSLPSASGATSFWQNAARVSVFAFRNAALQDAFQADVESRSESVRFFLPCCILGSWVIFLAHYLSSSEEVRALLPNGWPIAALHPLMAILFLSLQVAHTQLYIKHQKALHLSIF